MWELNFIVQLLMEMLMYLFSKISNSHLGDVLGPSPRYWRDIKFQRSIIEIIVGA